MPLKIYSIYSLLHPNQRQIHSSSCSSQKTWSHLSILLFLICPTSSSSELLLVLTSSLFRILALLTISTATSLVQATIFSHLDYHRSFLPGLPAFILASHSLFFTQLLKSSFLTPQSTPSQWYPISLMTRSPSPL